MKMFRVVIHAITGAPTTRNDVLRAMMPKNTV